ncbi:hypothetical protein CNR22_12055 [Sphingobacteriaceae bacterium]|nr:hypothetical protein CNR22_12055 [Sphingobacteriaceae bacterium]
MKNRGSDTYAIYNNVEYRLVRVGNIDKLISLDNSNNSIELQRGLLKYAYQTRKWASVKGCDAIVKEEENEVMILTVRPSEDVKILEAVEVEKGMYEAKINKYDIELLWEERYPLHGYLFPEDLKKTEKLDF